MIKVTITPRGMTPLSAIQEQIEREYPGASLKELRTDPGRYTCSLPTKSAENWNEGDRMFFEMLVRNTLLVGWAILGGL